jgi:hypothetical protein
MAASASSSTPLSAISGFSRMRSRTRGAISVARRIDCRTDRLVSPTCCAASSAKAATEEFSVAACLAMPPATW